MGGGVVRTVSHDVVAAGVTDALSALVGGPIRSGELKQNEAITFSNEAQPAPVAPRVEAQIRPVIHMEETQIKQQIEAVRAELKGLAVSVKKLDTQIQKAVADVPVHPGIYHINFLERLRNIIKALREHVNDSSMWLSMWSSRKKKKGYWGMYKKHGTTFGLSSERSLATQAG
jgi:hypothetical protein